MRLVVVALASLFTSVSLLAQLHPRPPQLMASENGQNPSPLSLSKADIHTIITGYLAETTMVLMFRNDGNRVLEGELSFPLPENATISGYGLDVNGYMVDGVSVEQQRARIIYEKEVRKRVDPGLVEQAVGNNFHTRVYPIPAKGTRTIKVQYVSDITQQGMDAVYRLPLNWGQVVAECTIRVEVVKAPAAPRAQANGAIKLGFAPFEDRFVAEQTLTNEKLDDELVVALPNVPRETVLVEHRTNAPSMDQLITNSKWELAAEYYFTINDTPPIPPVSRMVAMPKHVAVYWDASLSRLDADKTREIELLRKIFSGLDPRGALDLIAFRNEPDAAVSFPASDGFEAVADHLKKLVYDGGTSLNALHMTRHPKGVTGNSASMGNYDYSLLFTDGLSNLGPDSPAVMEGIVYAISNDVHSNHAMLKRLAIDSGGAYFNLLRVTDDQVRSGMDQTAYTLLGVEVDGREVSDIYPRGAQPVIGRVSIAGRLLTPTANVTLKYGYAGQVMQTREFVLTQQGAAKTGLVSRFWAQQKVADLSSDIEANATALAEVGRDFNLVTPNSSLLVLETVEQYLEHRIVPPKTRPDVYANFMEQIDHQKAKQMQTREEQLAAVQRLWDARVAWWNNEYKYAKDFAYVAPPQNAPHPVASFGTDRLPIVSATGRQVNQAQTLNSDGSNNRSGAGQGQPHPGADGPEDRLAVDESSQRRAAEAQNRSAMIVDLNGANTYTGTTTITGGVALQLTSPAPQERAKQLKSDDGKFGSDSFSIAVKPWDPAVPYLTAMREAGGDGAYATYLKQRPNYIASPAFYLDCADYLLRNNQRAMGIRVLTNIAELKLENAQLLRIVAHKLNQLGQRQLAIELFEKILRLRSDEPQSHRDLALALADRAAENYMLSSNLKVDQLGVRADYQRSLELLNKVIMTPWDRFPEIELTAVTEANCIWNQVQAMRQVAPEMICENPIDSRLIKNLDTDVRIVLTWDADQTDVDLWVTEPSGEKCFYNHNRTTIGGMLSHDFTQGYGPEEYLVRRALPGKYVIQANYYGSSQQSLVGPCTVQATVITDFGRPTEKREYLTIRVTAPKDVVDIGTITLGSKSEKN